jgi:hypothetical protein
LVLKLTGAEVGGVVAVFSVGVREEVKGFFLEVAEEGEGEGERRFTDEGVYKFWVSALRRGVVLLDGRELDRVRDDREEGLEVEIGNFKVGAVSGDEGDGLRSVMLSVVGETRLVMLAGRDESRGVSGIEALRLVSVLPSSRANTVFGDPDIRRGIDA